MAQRFKVKWLEGTQLEQEILYANDPTLFDNADQLAAHLQANPGGYTVWRDGSVPLSTSHMIEQAGLEGGRIVLPNDSIVFVRVYEGNE